MPNRINRAADFKSGRICTLGDRDAKTLALATSWQATQYLVVGNAGYSRNSLEGRFGVGRARVPTYHNGKPVKVINDQRVVPEYIETPLSVMAGGIAVDITPESAETVRRYGATTNRNDIDNLTSGLDSNTISAGWVGISGLFDDSVIAAQDFADTLKAAVKLLKSGTDPIVPSVDDVFDHINETLRAAGMRKVIIDMLGMCLVPDVTSDVLDAYSPSQDKFAKLVHVVLHSFLYYKRKTLDQSSIDRDVPLGTLESLILVNRFFHAIDSSDYGKNQGIIGRLIAYSAGNAVRGDWKWYLRPWARVIDAVATNDVAEALLDARMDRDIEVFDAGVQRMHWYYYINLNKIRDAMHLLSRFASKRPRDEQPVSIDRSVRDEILRHPNKAPNDLSFIVSLGDIKEIPFRNIEIAFGAAYAAMSKRLAEIPSPGAVVDVEQGRDISRMLMSEYAMLDPRLAMLFGYKYQQRQLLQYKMTLPESKARGPMILLLDISASTGGILTAISARSRSKAKEIREHFASFVKESITPDMTGGELDLVARSAISNILSKYPDDTIPISILDAEKAVALAFIKHAVRLKRRVSVFAYNARVYIHEGHGLDFDNNISMSNLLMLLAMESTGSTKTSSALDWALYEIKSRSLDHVAGGEEYDILVISDGDFNADRPQYTKMTDKHDLKHPPRVGVMLITGAGILNLPPYDCQFLEFFLKHRRSYRFGKNFSKLPGKELDQFILDLVNFMNTIPAGKWVLNYAYGSSTFEQIRRRLTIGYMLPGSLISAVDMENMLGFADSIAIWGSLQTLDAAAEIMADMLAGENGQIIYGESISNGRCKLPNNTTGGR